MIQMLVTTLVCSRSVNAGRFESIEYPSFAHRISALLSLSKYQGETGEG